MRFELCANSYQSIMNGIAGGAGCIELCEALEVGGVTPSFGTLKKCADVNDRISIRVLIRCRPGDYIYNDDEVAVMCEDIGLVKKLGYEGVVIGALNTGGSLDVPALKKMMTAGEGMKFTFHRAIDTCNNPLDAMKTLVCLGFDKVLTSGCKPTACDGIGMIREMQALFGDRIHVMAGGGINEKNVESIVATTGVRNCHASLTSYVADNHGDLYPDGVDDTGAVMRFKVSDLERIKKFVSIISNEK